MLKDPRYQSNNPNDGTILHRGGHRPYCEAPLNAEGKKTHYNDCEWPSHLGNPPWLATPQGISTPDATEQSKLDSLKAQVKAIEDGTNHYPVTIMTDPPISEVDSLKARIAELENPTATFSEADILRAQIAQLESRNASIPATGNTIPNNGTATRVKKEPEFIPMVLRNGFGVIDNPLGFSCKYDISHNDRQTLRYQELGLKVAGQSANGDALLGGTIQINKQYTNVQRDNMVIIVPKGTIVTINGNVI